MSLASHRWDHAAFLACRVMLPPHLQLDVLRVSCPHGRIFADMPALLRQCQEVHLQCSTAVLLGLVSEPLSGLLMSRCS